LTMAIAHEGMDPDLEVGLPHAVEPQWLHAVLARPARFESQGCLL
jgi:hypothetical protein